MLKFDVALSSIRDNLAHKVLLNVADKLPRYRFHFSVASEGVVSPMLATTPPKELACHVEHLRLVLFHGASPVEPCSTGASDVERFMPDKAHVVGAEIHLRRISAFLHPASCGVSSGLFMRMSKEAKESILTGTRGVDGGRKQKKIS